MRVGRLNGNVAATIQSLTLSHRRLCRPCSFKCIFLGMAFEQGVTVSSCIVGLEGFIWMQERRMGAPYCLQRVQGDVAAAEPRPSGLFVCGRSVSPLALTMKEASSPIMTHLLNAVIRASSPYTHY